jgi:hypothetical protein
VRTILIIGASIALAQAGGITVGGYVPLKADVNCVQENSEVGDGEVLLATCVVTNNAPDFAVKFDFGETENISGMRVQGGEGTLGVGLVPPSGYIEGAKEFVWDPGPQKAATLDYVIRFYGKINSHVLPFIEYCSFQNFL